MDDKGKKITDLDMLQNINDDAVMYIVQNGRDKKVSYGALLKNAKNETGDMSKYYDKDTVDEKIRDLKTEIDGKELKGVAEKTAETHNVSVSAHEDIRNLVSDLTRRLNAVADSDDIELDQLSEIVSYIKSNKTLIEGITTSKVSISDIVDNLTTNSSDRPLSAKQGQVLRVLVESKLGVDDIVDDLTTTSINKALSANQGNKLKSQIQDEIWDRINALNDLKEDVSNDYLKKTSLITTIGSGIKDQPVSAYVADQLNERIAEIGVVPKKLSEMENDKYFVDAEGVKEVIDSEGLLNEEEVNEIISTKKLIDQDQVSEMIADAAKIDYIKMCVEDKKEYLEAGLGKATIDGDDFSILFDKTEDELRNSLLISDSYFPERFYTPDLVAVYVETNGFFKGPAVDIRVGKYDITVYQCTEEDGTNWYAQLASYRVDYPYNIKPVDKTDEMTQPVGRGSSDGRLYVKPCVKPVDKTDEMTQEVGVDSEGKLYTAPSGGDGGTSEWEDLSGIPTILEEKITLEMIYEEKTVSFENGQCEDSFVTSDSFQEGISIVLTVDADVFTDVVQKTVVDGYTYYYIGNIGAAMGGEDTGEPYLLAFASVGGEEMSMLLLITDAELETSSHTVKIESKKTTSLRKRLPREYPMEQLAVNWNYIKDRPFYIDYSGVITDHVYFEDEVGGFGISSNGFLTGLYRVEGIKSIPYEKLIDKESTYDVTFDGVKYEDLKVTYEDSILGTVWALGNLSLEKPEDYSEGDIPFAIVGILGYDGLDTIGTALEGESHIIKVTSTYGKEKVVTLPEKYISEIGWNKIKGRPFDVKIKAREEFKYNAAEMVRGEKGIAVNVNGVEYCCVPLVKRVMNVAGPASWKLYLGNANIRDKTEIDTGEPFCISDNISVDLYSDPVKFKGDIDGPFFNYAEGYDLADIKSMEQGEVELFPIERNLSRPTWEDIQEPPFYDKFTMDIKTVYDETNLAEMINTNLTCDDDEVLVVTNDNNLEFIPIELFFEGNEFFTEEFHGTHSVDAGTSLVKTVGGMVGDKYRKVNYIGCKNSYIDKYLYDGSKGMEDDPAKYPNGMSHGIIYALWENGEYIGQGYITSASSDTADSYTDGVKRILCHMHDFQKMPKKFLPEILWEDINNKPYSGNGMVPYITSPNGTKYELIVNDNGELSTKTVER